MQNKAYTSEDGDQFPKTITLTDDKDNDITFANIPSNLILNVTSIEKNGNIDDLDEDNCVEKQHDENTLTEKICGDNFTLNILNEEENQKIEDACKYFQENFDNFVFEGGGIRGIAFGGALKFADDHDLIKNIVRFAGSSAGSIVAAAASVGYSGAEIIQILHDTNFEEFKDDSFGVIFDVWRFVNEFGVYKGNKFLDWIGNIIEKKTGNPDTTFKEVYDIYGKELVVTGTNVNKSITRYFHHKKDPDMPIRLAVRISMSIPVFFKAVKLQEYECSFCHNMMPDNGKPCYDCGKANYYECMGPKQNDPEVKCGEHIKSGYGICPLCKFKNIFSCTDCGEPLLKEMEDKTIKKNRIDKECWNCKFQILPKPCENVYVDGGVLNNYPIWVFDGHHIGDNHYTVEEINRSRSIGFKLMTDQEKKDYQLYHTDASISGIIDFFTCLINSMSIQIERGHIRTGYWDKTVTISTHNVNWLEFNLPSDTKEKLIQQGYNALHDKMLEIAGKLNGDISSKAVHPYDAPKSYDAPQKTI
jgi:predicted acylesterase/phospholipase RssA